nr:translation initiation factor 5-2 [Paratrimastix eleionoma]
MQYSGPMGTTRFNDAAYTQKEQMYSSEIHDLRIAAEVHREVRKYAREIIRPGCKLIEAVESIDTACRTLLKTNGLNHIESGIAFPCGLSLNSCAAHYTPNPGDQVVLQEGDLIKVDIGTHVHGHIIDAAFSMCWNPELQPVVEASREATNKGVELAGPDVLLQDLGDAIEEVITSYEATIGGKTYPLKPVRNLAGHMLGNYLVHAGEKSVPIAKNSGDPTTRMEEGELYAIETFASTGRGSITEDGETSHYMMDPQAPNTPVRNPKAEHLLHFIHRNYDTLAWCRRWLENAGETRHLMSLKHLADQGLVQPCPPLYDVRGSYVSQHEHTVFLGPSHKEVLSKGEDY